MGWATAQPRRCLDGPKAGAASVASVGCRPALIHEHVAGPTSRKPRQAAARPRTSAPRAHYLACLAHPAASRVAGSRTWLSRYFAGLGLPTLCWARARPCLQQPQARTSSTSLHRFGPGPRSLGVRATPTRIGAVRPGLDPRQDFYSRAGWKGYPRLAGPASQLRMTGLCEAVLRCSPRNCMVRS